MATIHVTQFGAPTSIVRSSVWIATIDEAVQELKRALISAEINSAIFTLPNERGQPVTARMFASTKPNGKREVFAEWIVQ